jgi:hypothetical protein
MDDADPQYSPVPADITVGMAEGGVQFFGVDIVASAEATAEQQRTLWVELVAKIEDFARANRTATILRVRVTPETPWGLVALGLAILYWVERGRGRR